ncbi:MAG: HlyD family efflux transporter periplasmic adaptor subunit [Candidatus Riflebacteria bacterium]|nr:HlyD family efflux transporter periplasmic adaptor subunit [Candidatus Riflebacteria bacterium]
MIRLAVAAVLVLAGLLFAVRPRGEQTLALAVHRARVADQVVSLEASGALEPETEKVVTVPREAAGGEIEEIVEEGTIVEKGAVLARLSTDRLEKAERGARNDLKGKEAELGKTRRDGIVAGAEDQQKVADRTSDLTKNRKELAYLEGGPDSRTVNALSLKIEKARLDEKYLTGRLAAQQELKNRGFLSELDYESIKTDLTKARLDLTKQENLLALQREGPLPQERERSRTLVTRFSHDLDLARKQATSQVKLRALAAAKKEAEIADRAASLDEARRKKRRATLTAPIAGIVVYAGSMFGTRIEVGADVWPGMQLVRVIQPGALRAQVQINERWIDRVKVGQPARVFPLGRSAACPARVHSISRIADPRDQKDPSSPRDFTVVLLLERVGPSGTVRGGAGGPARGNGPELRPALLCTATIEVARPRAVARLPVDLVRSRDKNQVELAALRAGKAVRFKATVVEEAPDHVYVTGVPDGTDLLFLDP